MMNRSDTGHKEASDVPCLGDAGRARSLIGRIASGEEEIASQARQHGHAPNILGASQYVGTPHSFRVIPSFFIFSKLIELAGSGDLQAPHPERYQRVDRSLLNSRG